jgi:hypothetical protein
MKNKIPLGLYRTTMKELKRIKINKLKLRLENPKIIEITDDDVILFLILHFELKIDEKEFFEKIRDYRKHFNDEYKT